MTAETKTPGWSGLTVLQCELRALFVDRPVNRAIAEALQRIGNRLGAEYAVVHARLGVHLLSEEWSQPGVDLALDAREAVNSVVWEAMSDETVRCRRLGEPGEDDRVVVTAVMYDQDIQQAGAAAMVLPARSDEEAMKDLLCLEGALGCLAMLVDGSLRRSEPVSEHRHIEPSGAADHPVRLALAITTDIKNRYGFDLVSVGFVRRSTVEVMAVSGMDQIRGSHPGVQLMRAAMEECLDRGAELVHNRSEDSMESGEKARLHAQWSRALDGDAVASFPLKFGEEIVAIVSMSKGSATVLDQDRVVRVADEMSGYGALVPLSRAANRSLLAHARDGCVDFARRFAGHGSRKALTIAIAVLLFVTWLGFGTMRHTFTVPCVVKAADGVVTSCPRDGVLAELFVRPGDHVRAGQLLAVLDANQDMLRRAELRAEIDSLVAEADKALADREFGKLRIYEAKKRSLVAQLAVVEANIEEAQIRAPRAGVILEGDLREQLGARLRAGDEMFRLARYDRAIVVLKIPEAMVLAAHDTESSEFAPAAAPDRRYELHGMRIAPASSIVDEKNVFLGEATVLTTLDGIAPGMEGVAHLDAGDRPAWWTLTHRLTDWLRLKFWL